MVSCLRDGSLPDSDAFGQQNNGNGDGDEGSCRRPVKTGQVLAVIDARDVDGMVRKSEAGLQEATMAQEEVERGIQAAQANLDLANATLKRYQELMAKKSVSLQEFDEVQSRQRAAAAQWRPCRPRKSRWNCQNGASPVRYGFFPGLKSYAEIRSPLNGVVVQRQAGTGQPGRARDAPVVGRRNGAIPAGSPG